jgi:hypothetical protein
MVNRVVDQTQKKNRKLVIRREVIIDGLEGWIKLLGCVGGGINENVCLRYHAAYVRFGTDTIPVIRTGLRNVKKF